MKQIAGGRTKYFEEFAGDCAKVIDGNDGIPTKVKFADRWEDNC